MMRAEGKAARSANRSSPWKSSYVAYGLLLGSLLVLLYLMVSTQFSYSQKDDAGRGMEEFSREQEEEEKAKAHTEPSTPRRQGNEMKSDNWEAKSQAKNEETAESKEFGGGTDDYNNVANTKPICDTSFGKYDICELAGDTRAQGGPGATVTLVSPRAPPKEWQIKPYSRKYLDGLKAVTVKSVPNPGDVPQCTTQLNIPAMVIELGGLTGNYWHDFTDVLVPLFIGARRFNGEVQLLVVNLLPFWVDRTNSRKILNLPEVIAAAEAAGFKVIVAGRPKASYDEFTREMNSFDVMVGVHGAGLTNCVYLPTGAVLLQIVPYGRLEEIARTDFGDPARDMGLRYIEYSVAAEESSLMGVFGKEHPMIKDPAAIHLSGWGNVAEWYLGKQDVRINVERFRPSLLRALEHLQ
ncbi:unnamed protein product [Triticum turgidum subsp. durum]|uniref:Glycosyltransferase 61 catalytic domain-containing protein n=1 Tax=Triticum turgidum subsp. durum TaxID=4567 RepID=A0A9R0ZXA5_TRITD|nr:unnamed protein product [Triticum turgidum subsp. durum]